MTIPAGTLVPRDARDFGSYQLLAKLATGGMAEIFLARPAGTSSKDVIVLKRILPHLAEDDHFVTMFRDEADLAAQLNHRNVCHVFGFGEHGGTWFMAMEYLHGVPLSRMMTRLSKAGKMLDLRMVAGIIVQACEGLHAAHDARGPDGHLLNVVHRDVSPPNIMVCGDGLVKLLDFGIAKARGANSRTRTGTVKGKNAYMSPEQILGKPLDRRSDVFALAIVMYEMLAIKRLFHRDSDFLTFKAITEEPIPDIRERRPDLPAGMRAALLQAMARDPNGRFDTAQAFGNAIRNSVATLGGPASPADLARLLFTDFGDEMSSRDEILKAADDASLLPMPAIPSTPAPPPSVKKPAPPPIPQTRAGELTKPPPLRPEHRARRPSDLVPVPSMIVQPGSSRVEMPAALMPQAQGTPAGVVGAPGANGANGAGNFIDLSANVPADTWMANPDTDLLRGHRMKQVRNIGIVFALLIAVGVGLFFASRYVGNDRRDDDTDPVTTAGGGATPDAAPRPVQHDAPPADAGMSKEDIIAISRFGYLTIDANQKTTIFIDGNRIGFTPQRRVPLTPGPHLVKAIGPNNKTREIKVIIVGGRDVDEGTINW
ncbi:MAG: protein kinase [Deltaproteobacteria bacterium]|nr:protein kinase [Deltaproteobacteria bacterium]